MLSRKHLELLFAEIQVIQFVTISRKVCVLHTMLSTDKNGAKIWKENPRVFTERKIRGNVCHEINLSLQPLQYSGQWRYFLPRYNNIVFVANASARNKHDCQVHSSKGLIYEKVGHFIWDLVTRDE